LRKPQDFLEKGIIFLCVRFCSLLAHADENAGCDLAPMGEIMGENNVLSRAV
jgi:hypothetical protein